MSPLLLRRLAWLLMALLVALAYAGTLDAPFVYDDKIEVIGNRTIRMLEHWRSVLGYNVSRPLLILTYAWNFERFGLDPRGYHVYNIAIHLLSVGAALELAVAGGRLFRLERPLRVGGAAVLLWALHPMLTESVTYTTGRSESLCGLFSFLSLAAWAVALVEEREGRRGAVYRLLGLLAFGGAAASKEVGWVVPGAALAMELLAPRGPAPARVSRWAWYLPFALLLGLGVMLKLRWTGGLLPREAERTLLVQLSTSAEVWLKYLRLWLLPVGQTLFHDQRDADPASLKGLLAWLGWGLMVLVGILAGRRRPATGWALLSAALFLLPSSSFVPLKEHMAEHRTYQSGLYLLLGLAWLLPSRLHRPAAVLTLALAPVLLWATLQRNAVWDNEVRLWEEATARRPDSGEAWYGLGDARRFAKDFAGARVAYLRATELAGEHVDTWINLGITAAELGNAVEARRAWRQALRIRPSSCKAHNNLGTLAYHEQDWDEAITELRSTLAYCPQDPIAHLRLGDIYYGPRRDPKRAIFHYERLVEYSPQFDHVDVVKQRLLELTW